MWNHAPEILYVYHVAMHQMSRDMTKPTKWLCAQRRLRSAWASSQSDQSSLSAWRNLGPLATHWAHREDSDQTGRMPRLIWVFAGRSHFVGFVISRLKYLSVAIAWQFTAMHFETIIESVKLTLLSFICVPFSNLHLISLNPSTTRVFLNHETKSIWSQSQTKGFSEINTVRLVFLDSFEFVQWHEVNYTECCYQREQGFSMIACLRHRRIHQVANSQPEIHTAA